jgi:hypothetical protein
MRVCVFDCTCVCHVDTYRTYTYHAEQCVYVHVEATLVWFHVQLREGMKLSYDDSYPEERVG